MAMGNVFTIDGPPLADVDGPGYSAAAFSPAIVARGFGASDLFSTRAKVIAGIFSAAALGLAVFAASRTRDF